MEITEDANAWKEYAYSSGIHGAILSFLEINKEWFYSIQETVDGSRYVTARGWEDLSKNIYIYEKKNYKVGKTLVGQFITNDEIVRKFCTYYDLYQKYRSDYQVEDILHGRERNSLQTKAKEARLDERISLLSLLLERIHELTKQEVIEDRILTSVVTSLRKMKKNLQKQPLLEQLNKEYGQRLEDLEKREHARSISTDGKLVERKALELLLEYASAAQGAKKEDKQFDTVKARFQKRAKQHEKQIEEAQACLEHVFSFVASTWGAKQEMVLLLTELTSDAACLEFIQNWGCEGYFTYNKDLLIYDVKEQLRQEVMDLDLESEIE